METPLLSVCLITYNHAKYIKEAVESILMQKVSFRWELVIADDFSTDNTREILLEYKEKYPERIKLIFQEKNVGPCKNFLDLITSPKSKYVAYLEGDDYWTDPLKLQKQVREMEKHPECLMSCHPAIVKHVSSSQPDAIKCNHGNATKIFTTKEVIAASGTFCPTSSLVFQRAMLNGNLPDFFLEMPDDYFIEVLGSIGGGLLYLSEPMSVYRSMSNGSWSEKNTKNFEYSLQYNLKYNGYLKALDAYLNHAYSTGIESKMTMMNYVMWRRFIKLNKKEFKDYESLKKQISQLKINKRLLVKALLANKIKAFLKPIL